MVFLFPASIFIAFCFIATCQGGNFDFKKFLDQSDPDTQEFSNLSDKLNMKFTDPAEVSKRLGYFRKAKQELKAFKNQFKDAKFVPNEFSLMSDEEVQKRLGVIPFSSNNNQSVRSKRNALDGIVDPVAPASYDFRAYGKVTPSKTQGGCGACYAFAAAAAIESQYLIRLNLSLDLSEQYIVSCNTMTLKCAGGDMVMSYNYVQKHGIPLESCQPYTATDGVCTNKCDSQKYYVDGYHHFGYDESEFALQLYNYGPATASIYLPRALLSYSSGIMSLPEAACKANSIGFHAVLIVGYTADYWIGKNSWGPSWGENGFFRFKRGENFCGMKNSVAAPYLSSSLVPNTTTTTTTTVKPANTTTTTTMTTKTTTTTKTNSNLPPSANCPAGNGITTMNNATRNYALNLFNAKRSDVVNSGLQMTNGGYTPSGQNMKKLVYDCSLEVAAQQYANTCTKPGNVPYAYLALLAVPYNWNINVSLENAASSFNFFSVISQNLKAVVTSGDAAFAYDDATSIGCAYSNAQCFGPNIQAILACAVTPIRPLSAPLYSTGIDCFMDYQCTKPGYNKCDAALGLCYP